MNTIHTLRSQWIDREALGTGKKLRGNIIPRMLFVSISRLVTIECPSERVSGKSASDHSLTHFFAISATGWLRGVLCSPLFMCEVHVYIKDTGKHLPYSIFIRTHRIC